MRKLLLVGAVLAAPLVGWGSAQAASAPFTTGAAVTAPSASVQNVVWVWVGGHRVWRHGYWRPYLARGHWIPGHWRYGHWVPGHFA
jgi:hypothetical protein